MPKSVTEYDILISCPGDVNDTVPLINEVLQQFNDTYTDVLAIRLIPKHWTTDSYNQSGGKPQDLLNKQFVHNCDAAIAIFWARFGTPTDRYGSGAEEEIEDMLAAGKQVFMYFCNKPVAPKLMLDDNARAQYQKVKEFQARYRDEGKGIYDTYSSDDEFRKKLFAHVSQHFLSLKKVESIESQRRSKLLLKGIVSGHLCDCYSIEPFSPYGVQTTKQRLEEIKSLFFKVAGYSFADKQLDKMSSYLAEKVTLEAVVVSAIEKMADVLKLDLPNNFFALGALSKEHNLTASIFGNRKVNGTKEEIEKYNAIMNLYENIEDYLGYSLFESEFSNLMCIRLAVSNLGTAFDEDVDIALSVPKGSILLPHQFPELNNYTCKHMITDYSIDELFGIPATASYNDFDSSIDAQYPSFPNQHGLIPLERDYIDEFNDAIDTAFFYGFFEEADEMIVKLHVDYIKHNTSVAFPTVLFLTQPLSEIKYTIRSKQNEAETNGVIYLGEANETKV